MKEAEKLFRESLEALGEKYYSDYYFKERDFVWTLQKDLRSPQRYN